MSTPELQPHSLIYSRILNVLIVVQLLAVTIGWLQLQSLRHMSAEALQRQAALARQGLYLNELQAAVLRAQAIVPVPDAAEQKAVTRELTLPLLGLSQAEANLPMDEAASAMAQANVYQQLAATSPAVGSPVSTAFHDAVSQTATHVAQWQVLRAKAAALHGEALARMHRAYGSAKWIFGFMPLTILLTALCAAMLKRGAREQSLIRENMEAELRRERSLLEKRIASRTAEMQAEVAERQRAEQLNRGRNQLLEMLAREEPQQEIFKALVNVIAKDRSRWCCVLHLLKQGELQMQAHSGLPVSLVRNLQHVAINMADAPEAAALRNRSPEVLHELASDRKPWTQLLHASGIQSLWAVPIFAPDATPLGTLTVYSLLRAVPSEADMALLESHAQMASMVLERYRLQEELRRHAYHDSLTGLPNRLLGEEQLSAAIRRGRRNGKSVAVLWIDLDKFKQTNDVHGHVAGDAVLKEVAVRLARRCRESDTVSRVGGDEFMAVLEDVGTRASAESIARELLEALAQPIPFQELMLTAAASVGVSMFPEDGDSAEQLQRNADMAMYEAKFGGHGVRAFSAALDALLTERRDLETAMIHALEHGGFKLHYQAQYRRDGSLAGFEALLRFPHPVLGMIPPTRLIALAEESQMIVALGLWVLREACRQGKVWRDAGFGSTRIAVNISAMQFVRPDFADQVAAALKEFWMPPELLELELTESVMVEDFIESSRQLQRLKKLGVSIALDDFGTGYSSLNQLHRLPIDRLKIDRSFVQAMSEPEGTFPIVESIIGMAHSMNARVVAEGVETQAQLETLCAMGCDCLQGYLLSKPVEAEQAGLLLSQGVSRHFRHNASRMLAFTPPELVVRELAGA